ncbi:NAD(P)/FAD-dependent oxidoreductase [Pseudooceanicola pacificus]|uniref:hypothetical protein n=1 Tax=Pseudooceanicola pacificus TaxID=2676438 RepID=UPI0013663EA2|nr:hypothetical protein [Pseudooceanicola pacificus]
MARALWERGLAFDIFGIGPDIGAWRDCAHAIAANGHLWDPRFPDFPCTFDGPSIHPQDNRTAAPFDGTRGLVVGCGNSAANCAVGPARRAGQVSVSTCRSARVMPKDLMGIPGSANGPAFRCAGGACRPLSHAGWWCD